MYPFEQISLNSTIFFCLEECICSLNIAA
uniref:Uncharacterized protein n=1 Tax=Arundo donax TaxID=35708 RepID=A0A0A9F3L4_ARUDO